jgi:hypothetical protein
MSPLQSVAWPWPQKELTDNPKMTSFIPATRLGITTLLLLKLYLRSGLGDESGHRGTVLFDLGRRQFE